MMNAKERLRRFVEYRGMGRNRFEELTGISVGYLSTKSPSVGSEIIERIARIYHDLNIEWLVTGQGKMIKSPYLIETGTVAGSNYKKLVHAPLISRYAQTEYINRLDDKPYIDTLPTFPVIIEHGHEGKSRGKDSYVCFEMWNDGMNDGSDNSFNPGDILICREIDYAIRQRKLYFNKPKAFIIIHVEEGITVGQITSHDTKTEIITLHSPNPLCDDRTIRLQDVKKLFNVTKLQRIVE
jgi:transcriptional regulator with XRE-family HTH domain